MFEVIFENKTFVCKSFNRDRRLLLIEDVFKFQLGKKPREIESVKFVKEFFIRCKKVLWSFIKDEDKYKLGTFESFSEKLEYGQVLNFLEWCKTQIQGINDFMKANGGDKAGEVFDREFVISYLVNKTSWRRSYIEELEETKIFLLLKHFSRIDKMNRIDRVRELALGVASGRGNKKANEAVKTLEKDLKNEERMEALYDAVRNKKAVQTKKVVLTPEQLKKLNEV